LLVYGHTTRSRSRGHTEWAFSEDVATRFIATAGKVTRVGRRQRPRDAASAPSDLSGRRHPPTLVICGQPHRLGRANKAGHPRGARRARWVTKRGPADKGEYGWPEGLARFPRPRPAVREHFAGGGGGARAGGARGVAWRRSSATGPPIPSSPTTSSRCSTGAPDGWDKGLAPFPADARRCGRPRCLGQGAQHPRPETRRGSSAAPPTSRPRRKDAA